MPITPAGYRPPPAAGPPSARPARAPASGGAGRRGEGRIWEEAQCSEEGEDNEEGEGTGRGGNRKNAKEGHWPRPVPPLGYGKYQRHHWVP